MLGRLTRATLSIITGNRLNCRTRSPRTLRSREMCDFRRNYRKKKLALPRPFVFSLDKPRPSYTALVTVSSRTARVYSRKWNPVVWFSLCVANVSRQENRPGFSFGPFGRVSFTRSLIATSSPFSRAEGTAERIKKKKLKRKTSVY